MDYLRLIKTLIAAALPGFVLAFGLRLNECVVEDLSIAKFFKLSIGQCASTCRGADNCRYVAYRLKTFQCNLLRNVTSTVPCMGGAILDVDSREGKKFSACSPSRCSKRPVEKDLALHALQFCPKPNVTNIYSLVGNQQLIDSKILIFCWLRYPVRLEGLSWTKCLPNGTWSQHGRCVPLCTERKSKFPVAGGEASATTDVNGTPEYDETVNDNEASIPNRMAMLYVLNPDVVSVVQNPFLPLQQSLPGPCEPLDRDTLCKNSILPNKPHHETSNGETVLYSKYCAYNVTDKIVISTLFGEYVRLYML